MTRFIATFTLSLMLLAPTAAMAYVGPGAGLSLLGALWALVLALVTAVAFVVAWPLRRMFRRRRMNRQSAVADDTGETSAAHAPHPLSAAARAERSR